MFELPNEQILQKLEPVFVDRGESITYRRHTGTTRVAGINTDEFDEFTCVALTGKPHKWSTSVASGTQMQVQSRSFIFKVEDLPTGVTPAMLTRNDKIEHGSQTYDVADIRWVEGLFVRVQIEAA